MDTTHQHVGDGRLNTRDMIVAIDHQSARLFHASQSLAGSTQPLALTPHDPHGFHRHLTHKKEANYEGERVPEDPQFYEHIAAALTGAHRILIIGHGTGKSDAGIHLMDELKKRHVAVADKVLDVIAADLSHMTDGQILALARSHLTEAEARRRVGLSPVVP